MSQPESDQQRAPSVRPEQADPSAPVQGPNAAFAPDLPESIPKLHVPGLSPDATSVPPEALRGEVPTLTEAFLPEVEVSAPAAPAAPAVAPSHAPAQAHASSIHTFDEIDLEADRDKQVVPALVAPVVPELESAPQALQEAIQEAPLQADEVLEPVLDAHAPDEQTLPEQEQQAQEPAAEADTWAVQMQARIGKLNDEIGLLNDRLDRFEKLPKA